MEDNKVDYLHSWLPLKFSGHLSRAVFPEAYRSFQ